MLTTWQVTQCHAWLVAVVPAVLRHSPQCANSIPPTPGPHPPKPPSPPARWPKPTHPLSSLSVWLPECVTLASTCRPSPAGGWSPGPGYSLATRPTACTRTYTPTTVGGREAINGSSTDLTGTDTRVTSKATPTVKARMWPAKRMKRYPLALGCWYPSLWWGEWKRSRGENRRKLR